MIIISHLSNCGHRRNKVEGYGEHYSVRNHIADARVRRKLWGPEVGGVSPPSRETDYAWQVVVGHNSADEKKQVERAMIYDVFSGVCMHYCNIFITCNNTKMCKGKSQKELLLIDWQSFWKLFTLLQL